MLHHVSVGVLDVARAAQFYDATLGALGYKRQAEYLPYAIAYGIAEPAFWIQLPHNQQPANPGNGVHIGFTARTKGAVQKFHEAALSNGGRDDGAPGPRDMYGPDYYGAFVFDLDGNKLEATLHPKTTSKPKARAKALAKPKRRATKRRSKKPAARKVRRKR